MNNIYDNGEMLLGRVDDIIKYINIHQENWDEDVAKEILEEIKDYENDTILVINYDNGMGWRLDYWTRKDIIKEMS